MLSCELSVLCWYSASVTYMLSHDVAVLHPVNDRSSQYGTNSALPADEMAEHDLSLREWWSFTAGQSIGVARTECTIINSADPTHVKLTFYNRTIGLTVGLHWTELNWTELRFITLWRSRISIDFTRSVPDLRIRRSVQYSCEAGVLQARRSLLPFFFYCPLFSNVLVLVSCKLLL